MLWTKHETGLLTGCGKKMKIVQVLGGKLCGKKQRLCGIAQSCKQTNIRSLGPKKPDMVAFLDK